MRPLHLNTANLASAHSNKKFQKLLREGIRYDMKEPNWEYLRQVKFETIPDKNYDILSDTIEKYRQCGFISECKDVKGVFPIHLVPKKDGGFRLVHNLVRLNKLFVAPKVKLPTPFSILRKNVKYVAKLDLENAYFHFRLEKEFSKLFGFLHQGKHYKFNVLPFGWSMSPFLAIRLLKPIENILKQRFPDAAISLYIDDLFIGAESKEECQHIIHAALKLFDQMGISVNREKSMLTPSDVVEWLGFKFKDNKLSQTNNSLQKLGTLWQEYKQKQSLGSAMSLLGLLNFMARIIPPLRPVASYLISVIPFKLRTNKSLYNEIWKFTEESFDLLQRAINRVLQNEQFEIRYNNKTVEVWVDASEKMAGMASKRAETSIKFPKHIANSNILVKEAFAIYKAVLEAPDNVNLRVHTDSKACFYTFKKGICENLQVLDFIQASYGEAIKKNVSFVLNFVRTDKNLADYSSRNACRAPFWSIYQDQQNMPKSFIVDFLDYNTVQGHQELTQIIQSHMQSKKKRGYMVEKFKDKLPKIIDEEFRPLQRRALVQAVAANRVIYAPAPRYQARQVQQQQQAPQQQIDLLQHFNQVERIIIQNVQDVRNDQIRDQIIDEARVWDPSIVQNANSESEINAAVSPVRADHNFSDLLDMSDQDQREESKHQSNARSHISGRQFEPLDLGESEEEKEEEKKEAPMSRVEWLLSLRPPVRPQVQQVIEDNVSEESWKKELERDLEELKRKRAEQIEEYKQALIPERVHSRRDSVDSEYSVKVESKSPKLLIQQEDIPLEQQQLLNESEHFIIPRNVSIPRLVFREESKSAERQRSQYQSCKEESKSGNQSRLLKSSLKKPSSNESNKSEKKVSFVIPSRKDLLNLSESNRKVNNEVFRSMTPERLEQLINQVEQDGLDIGLRVQRSPEEISQLYHNQAMQIQYGIDPMNNPRLFAGVSQREMQQKNFPSSPRQEQGLVNLEQALLREQEMQQQMLAVIAKEKSLEFEEYTKVLRKPKYMIGDLQGKRYKLTNVSESREPMVFERFQAFQAKKINPVQQIEQIQINNRKQLLKAKLANIRKELDRQSSLSIERCKKGEQ